MLGNKNLSFECLNEKSNVKPFEGVTVAEEDVWIYGANCLHFAAKFNPIGLQMILSNVKGNYKSKLMEDAHVEGKMSALHVAACNHSALATR